MTVALTIDHTTDIAAEDYLAVGLAACYQLEDGDLQAVQVLEPIPSASLEALFLGVPTSYQQVWGTTVGAVLSEEPPFMAAIQGGSLCRNFSDRVTAAARTYKSRPAAAALVKIGASRTDMNFSTDRKRVLNQRNTVTKEDNVRQHQYTHQTL